MKQEEDYYNHSVDFLSKDVNIPLDWGEFFYKRNIGAKLAIIYITFLDFLESDLNLDEHEH